MSAAELALWRVQSVGKDLPDRSAFYADIEVIRQALQRPYAYAVAYADNPLVPVSENVSMQMAYLWAENTALEDDEFRYVVIRCAAQGEWERDE